MKDLHPLQDKLLKLLAQNSDDPLTIRQMQEELEVSSTSVVAHHMQALEKKGFLKRNPYNSKDYQVMTAAPETMVSHINLYGMAACGPEGSILDGNPDERIPISSKLISFPVMEAFMVKAKGKSMEPRIFEGDFIIARRTNIEESGKVYVCVNDGQAVVKKLQVEGKIKILHSFNPAFEPFIAAKDFRVEGEVRGLISRKI